MVSSSSVIATVISSYMPLITIILIRGTVARELRPSDHGLEYQSSLPPLRAKSSPQMTSFFKGSSASLRPPSSPSSSGFALPKVMNSTDDTSWWSSREAGGRRRSHVRHVALVASLACGVTGVALLIASAFIYLFRSQNRNSSSSSCPNNNITNTRK